MRTHLAVALTLAALAATFPPPASAARGPRAPETLEGTRWEVQVVPGELSRAQGELPFAETLAFENGQIVTCEWPSHGFPPASRYKEKKRKDKLTFESDQKGQAGEKAEWSGDVRSGLMRGILVWKQKDGSEINYWFRGRAEAPTP